MDTLREAGDGGKPGTGVGVLDRAVRLLDLLADGPAPLRLLAERSGLPRPTAHRLLVALTAHGLAARAEGGGFRLGPRLTELAVRAGPAVGLAGLAGPVLAGLHAATGESVQLYVRSGDQRLCVAARDSGASLSYSVPVGALLPLDAGSGGKVLLAWSADADQFTAVPAAELAAVRRRGYAASVAEREAGVASVSAPVLKKDRPEGPLPADARSGTGARPPAGAGLIAGGPQEARLLAALCVSGPVSRLGSAPGKTLAPLVTEAAAQLAARAAVPG